jgi:hypothetical protein
VQVPHPFLAQREGDQQVERVFRVREDNNVNVNDPPPVDAVTWAVLAGVAQTSFPDDVSSILEHAFHTIFTIDSPVFEEGCEPEVAFPNPIQGSWVPCDFLHKAYLYEGFKFSKEGYGPQWENAGSGSMDLRLLQHRNTTDSIKSLVKLWKKYPTGVPAHFEIEETKKVASADVFALDTECQA